MTADTKIITGCFGQLGTAFSRIFKTTSNMEGQGLVCRVFFDRGVHEVCLALLFLYSFPHVFVYLCPTGA